MPSHIGRHGSSMDDGGRSSRRLIGLTKYSSTPISKQYIKLMLIGAINFFVYGTTGTICFEYYFIFLAPICDTTTYKPTTNTT